MILWGYDVRFYFILFMIYAVMGWAMEVICKLVQYKKFINRGFLIGPYCPIYGYGAICITILLKKYLDDPIVLFTMTIVICGIIEYLTSYFMEKKFKTRWWDYSQRKFNINGRICLNTIIPFGILGLLIMYVLNPFFLSKISLLPQFWLNFITVALFVIYIADNIISTVVIGYLKKARKIVGKNLDNTEEITAEVKEILQEKSALHRRLVNAYPKLQTVKIKVKERADEIKKKGKEVKDNIEEKSKQIKGKLMGQNEE